MKNRVCIAALGVLSLAVGSNCLANWGSNPLLAVQEHAQELGWEAQSLDFRGGGYSTGFFELSAYGTYQPRDQARGREVYLEVNRPLPFAEWQLVEYRVR